MRLIGIDCQIPSTKVFNEDIVELVKFYSDGRYKGSLDDLETLIRRFLKLTGSRTRFWRAEDEKPLSLINTAVERSLKMAGIKKDEIGLMIYSGIDRGFIEPSNASVLCKALGISKARCFDIVDACMGWSSAVQTAYSFLNTNEALKYAMLINAEFPMDKKGTILPENYVINNVSELDWKAPSFTLGEACSVCIFKKEKELPLQFAFHEEAIHADLCSIPLMNSEKYLPDEESPKADMRFYSMGAQLLEKGMQPAVNVLQELFEKMKDKPKMIFPHSISHKVIEEASRKAGINVKSYSTFQELGNLATVSIPSAITKALLNHDINHDDKIVGWVASAGMKFSAFEIQL
jgi:3-oxoacyl-[acyl-carrier-protein] synthase III